jgi:hypothetical protein
MNAELLNTFQSPENTRPASAADESRQASEKMLSEMMKAKCDDSSTKCVPPQVEQYGKLDRFLMPSEMNITPTEAAVKMLPSGDVISQKGTSQRLALREGTSIEVNGDGTFAVRDAQGRRIQGDIVMIKPMPGYEPRGLNLAFGDEAHAEIVDGRINFRTRGGASVEVDNRGFVSISRPESLRMDDTRKK